MKLQLFNKRFIFIASIALTMIGQGLIIPLLTKIINSNIESSLIIGIMIASYSLGTLLSAPFSGDYINSNGSKKTLELSLITYMILLFLTLNSHHIIIIIILRFLSGVFMSLIFACIETYIAKHQAVNNRSVDYLLISISNSIGMILGPILGILLLTNFKNSLLVFLIFVSIVLILLIHYNIDEQSTLSLPHKLDTHSFVQDFKILSKNSYIVYVLVAFAIFGFISTSFESFGLSYITLNYDILPLVHNILFYLSYVIEIILIIIVSIIYLFCFNPTTIKNLGSYTIIFLSSLITAVSLFFAIITSNFYIFILVIGIMVVGLSVYSNSIILFISQIDYNKGLALGLKNSMMGVGGFLGPILSGYLFAINQNFFILFLIFLLLIIALWNILLSKYKRK